MINLGNIVSFCDGLVGEDSLSEELCAAVDAGREASAVYWLLQIVKQANEALADVTEDVIHTIDRETLEENDDPSP